MRETGLHYDFASLESRLSCKLQTHAGRMGVNRRPVPKVDGHHQDTDTVTRLLLASLSSEIPKACRGLISQVPITCE
jgi:hypothetical protein